MRSLPFDQRLGLPLGLALALLGACDTAQPGPVDDDGPVSTSSGGTDGKTKLDVPSEDGGTGGTDGSGGKAVTSVEADCARTTVTADDTTSALPADIIFLVDSSPSMLEEIGFVQANLNAFSQRLNDEGVDARVILISETIPADVPPEERHTVAGVCMDPPLGSGACPDDSLLPNYVHIEYPIQGTNSLDVLMSTKDDWIVHKRPGAITSIVVISDEDGVYPRSIVYGDPPRWEDIDFMSDQFFNGFSKSHLDLLEPWTLNGVFGFSVCEYSDEVGTLFARLVDMTGGVAGDICEQDFEPVFDSLATRVALDAEEIWCEWELPDTIPGQTFSTELVQVTRVSGSGSTEELFQVASDAECVPGGWHFDDGANPSRILACAETCEELQSDTKGTIDVVFGCEIALGCSASGVGTLAEGSEVADCAWPMPKAEEAGTVVDQDSLNVRYVTESGFGVLLGLVDDAADCASVDLGYYYDDAEAPSSIALCPTTCDTVEAADVAKVEALFGCTTKDAVVK
jgi:hypothetical protein